MKIFQLIQKPQRRGAEIFAIQLSESLISLGHEVKLIALYKNEKQLSFKGDLIFLDRLLQRRFFDFEGWRQLSDLIKEFQPDLVQANAADTLKFAVFSRLIFGWKAKLVYRNANQMGDFIRGFWHRKFNQFLVDRLEGVISVSEASQIDFFKTFRFPVQKSRTIPIGIVSRDIDKKLKEVQKLPPSRYLIQIGSWVPEKDSLGMLDMFVQLQDESLNLVFLGSGPLEEEMRRKILDLGLLHRVTLLPNRANIFPILSRAQALVMPSKIEGLPAVILEAMYCRVPVVAYGVGGIPEVLESGKTGWCIDPEDREAFVQAIQEVLEMEEDRKKKILDSAFDLVTSDYNLSTLAIKFEKFYREILE